MQNDIICPNCNSKCSIALDGCGYTPWHIHCDNCNINIGSTSVEKGIELLHIYHKPKTWIEFYNKEIQILYEDGKMIYNKEIKNAE